MMEVDGDHKMHVEPDGDEDDHYEGVKLHPPSPEADHLPKDKLTQILADMGNLSSPVKAVSPFKTEDVSEEVRFKEEDELIAAIDQCAENGNASEYLANILSFTRTFAEVCHLDKEPFSPDELLEALEESETSKLFERVTLKLLNTMLNRKNLLT
jgi:hypothetical protein